MTKSRSFIISVFGPKAGVGKTIFATNLIHALVRQSRGQALLVDLDPHDCGDISILLGASPRSSCLELAPLSAKLGEEELFKQLFHHSSGIWILPGCHQPKHFATLIPDSVQRLLTLCRNQFQYMVVDCGSDITPLTTKIFEISSLILFCTTPEILTLSRSVHSLNDFQSLAFPSDLIEIIVNRYNSKGVITESIIRQKLRRDCLALLPDTPQELENSIHQGIPLFVSAPRAPYSQVIDQLCSALLTKGLLRSVEKIKLKAPTSTDTTHSVTSPSAQLRVQGKPRVTDEEADRLSQLRMKIHHRLIEVMDFRRFSTDELVKQDQKTLQELREKTLEAILGIIDKMSEIQSREERQQISKEVLDEALGLGPLEDLLADDDVSEILVNGPHQIYVERKGKLAPVHTRFTTERHLLGVIERIVAPVGRRIDEKTPMVDARLRDGSRVHAVISPLAIDGPMLTIRKFSQMILGPQQLVALGTLTDEIADFLRACVEARLNVLISGGTGTGKTTLLNILAGYIPTHERIITVEDSAELRLPQIHVGRLEARPPNLQGEGSIPIRELVRNTLRMRPDRIIVGECRGAEALDMLQAMNTGHDGSMTTIHSNSPRDCMSRLETLVMFAGMDLPSKAIREQITNAIQLIIQLNRMSDGSRKITAITEVAGVENSDIVLADIFVFRQKGLDAAGQVVGAFQATGLVPTFAHRFAEKGIKMPKGLSGTDPS